MAIFGKKERDENSPVVQPPPIQKEMTEAQQKNPQKFAAKAPIKEASKETTYFGKNLKIKGNVSGEGNLIVLGSFEGEFKINGQVKVSQGAEIKGDIKATSVSINGNFEGTISASERILLDSTAAIKGRLVTPKISIQDGAVFDGELQMNRQPVQPPQVSTPDQKKPEAKPAVAEIK
jgi:cytoskeletal protein CcmA (bactofilin family)